jgi:hypothetical protein
MWLTESYSGSFVTITSANLLEKSRQAQHKRIFLSWWQNRVSSYSICKVCSLWSRGKETRAEGRPASKLLTVAPSICGTYAGNLLHVIRLAPGILTWLLDFLKNVFTPALTRQAPHLHDQSRAYNELLDRKFSEAVHVRASPCQTAIRGHWQIYKHNLFNRSKISNIEDRYN